MNLLKRYDLLLNTKPLPTKVCTSVLIASLGDLIS